MPRRPGPDDLVWTSELVVAGGGPAATAAVALSRLGVPTFFVGSIGDDATGAAIREGLEREGVDVSELVVVPGAQSPQSSILVAEGSAGRSIVAYPGTMPRLEMTARARELCEGADWVHVDQTGYAAVPRNVRLSIDAGNPVEGLDLRGVALYGPTEQALREQFRAPQDALDKGAELVVVTRGDQGSVAYTHAGDVFEAPAFALKAVSTLGAGDVFHGALLAQLVHGLPIPEALALANRCAALSCRALDGRSAIPTAAELA